MSEDVTKPTNTLVSLPESLSAGLTEKFGIPDDGDPFQRAVVKAVRILRELAKVESLYERMNAKASKGRAAEAEELAHELHLAKGSMFANCRAIAEEE